jgi:hypothetical protein
MGGLGLVDQWDVIEIFPSKWVIHVLEPMNSKLQRFLNTVFKSSTKEGREMTP